MAVLNHEGGYKIDDTPQYSITTTPQLLNTNGRTVLVQNTGSTTVYISATSTVDNTKWPLPAGSTLNHITGSFYCATLTGTSTVNFLALGNI